MSEDQQAESHITDKSQNQLETKGITLNKNLVIKLLLLLFIVFFVAQNYAFINKDTAPKFTDYQMTKALHYYDLFMNDEYNYLSSISYPPLVYVITRSYFLRMGVNQLAARLSLGIFWIVFLLSMFGIGKELGDEYSGFAVLLLAASSPHFINYSRNYYLDFPQAATTAAAFYFLLKSDFFKKRAYSMLFGIFTAITILTKWSAIFFLVIPILWFLIPFLFKNLKSIAVFLLFIASTTWWVINLSNFYRYLAGQNDPVQQWLKKYLVIFIPPLMLCLIITIILDLVWRRKEGYWESPQYRVINFNYASILAVFPAGMWFVYAGKKNADRFLAEVKEISHFHLIAKNMSVMKGAALTMFNLLPILIIVSIVFLFYKKKNLYRLLLLPVNFAASFILVVRMATLDRDPSRYIISLIIFSAAFCGYWVTKTGKWKKWIMGAIAVLSLISILAWTVIPGTLPLYQPVKMGLSLAKQSLTMKVLCSEPYNSSKTDVEELIKNLKLGRRDFDFLLFVYSQADEREKQALYELLQTEMYKQGKRQGISGTDYKSITPETFRPHWRRLKGRNIPNIILITEKDNKGDKFINIIKTSPKIESTDWEIYPISNNYNAYLIHVKREERNNTPERENINP